MSVTFPGYPRIGYPSFNQTAPSPFQALPTGLPTPLQAQIAPYLITQPITEFRSGTSSHNLPSVPQTSQRLKSLAKALLLIAPAIALAKFAPSQASHAVKEWFPSDWKVLAKMGLGVASMTQLNKALDWTPPAWLGAFMNVSVMAGLLSGLTTHSLKTILILGPTMAALVQGTQYAGNKLEKPLQENYNIPPLATRLTLSILSMCAGFWALPLVAEKAQASWSFITRTEAEANALKQSSTNPQPSTTTTQNKAQTRVVATSGCGCCGGPICLNEAANNGAIALDSIKKHFANHKKESQ